MEELRNGDEFLKLGQNNGKFQKKTTKRSLTGSKSDISPKLFSVLPWRATATWLPFTLTKSFCFYYIARVQEKIINHQKVIINN